MARPERPVLVIVAGPNGAGKTTIAHLGPGGILREFFGNQPVLRLNADDLARRLEAAGARPSDETNLFAARETDAALARAIDERRSVVVETVLSSDKYRPLLNAARAASFIVVLVYVCLRSPTLSRQRVRQRVAKGGHGVPDDRIAPRWARSLDNLEWFGLRADAVFVYDNSGRTPVTLFSRSEHGVEAPGLADRKLPRALAARLRALQGG